MSHRQPLLLLVLLLLPVLAACELDPFALERDGEVRVQVLADELGDEAAPANGSLAGDVEFRVRVVAELADGSEMVVTDGTQSGRQAFGASAGTLAARRFPPSNIANLRVEFHDVSVRVTDGRELGLFPVRYAVNIAPGSPVIHDVGPVDIPAGVQRTLRIDFAARSWLVEQEGQTIPAAVFRDRVRVSIR